ncbi:hypothetical protein ACFSHT_32305 [Paraburkholderia silviterrae]|uniref:Uncharacterized protein n=1 Tax=Paraburkholderia silviterrae TaxID=2528715 RepID=A0A4R5M2L3_9BURK|nr:hypothetical protein [Paraburkholderia silviterrae]TDG19721.1 hypothetical protein EYW47_29590 [Paraburkholderia silviterrae]
MKPFFLLVPRGSDKGIADADAEDLARMAIAQSLRDGLLEAHPEGALDLTAVGLRWDGDLTDGQWLHD